MSMLAAMLIRASLGAATPLTASGEQVPPEANSTPITYTI